MTTRSVATAIAFLATGLGAGSSAPANFAEVWVPLEIEVAILRDPALIQYFHLDTPGRLPVKVSARLSHPDLESADLGYSVKLVPEGSSEAAEAFQFGAYEVSAHHAAVDVSYPIEGVFGRYSLVRRGKHWVVKSRSLREQ